MNALLPLTHAQKRVWLTDQVFPGNSYNNLSATIKIYALLDIHLMKRAIASVVQNNDSLRLRFIDTEDGVFQKLIDCVDFEIEYRDFSNNETACLEWIHQETIQPFLNLEADLFRFAVLKLSENETWVYYKLHHLISDGSTIVAVSNRILSGYLSLLNDEVVSSNNPSYLDYIVNEQNYFNSKRFIKDRQFWDKEFATPPSKFSIAKDKEENKLNNLNAKRVVIEMTESQRKEVEDLCSRYQVGIASFLLSTVYIALYIMTQEEDLAITTFIANRTEHNEKEMTGAFVSTCPIRMQIDPDDGFIKFVKAFSMKYLNIMRHQKFPFDMLLDGIKGRRSENLKAFTFNADYQYAETQKFGDLDYELDQIFNGNELFDVSIHFKDVAASGMLKIYFDYKQDYMTEEELMDFASQIMNVIHNLHTDPEVKMRDLAYNPARNDIIRHQFNNTDMPIDTEKLFKQLFEEQAEIAPNSVALTFNNKTITYGELNRLSNQLAYLLKEKGVKGGSIVGIYCNRSVELMVFILAVIKAGGAYLPLDPEMPDDRLKYMICDSGIRIMLTNKDVQDVDVYSEYVREIISIPDCISELPHLPSDNLIVNSDPDDLVYVIYTSGSTGRPKGVMIEQLSLLNFIYGMHNAIPFLSFSKVLAVTTFSFDIFVVETLIPLAFGINVILADDEHHNNPSKLNRLIIDENIDMIQMTPSRMSILLSDPQISKALQCVKHILLGGEQLTDKLLSDIKKISDAQIFNLYGPTEATVWATVQNMTNESRISIGKPLANTKVYVMDENRFILPPEVVGEIVISGKGVARGYMNNKELTDQQFIPDPYADSACMYKTGDFGKWSWDGQLHIVGRKDQQVKIRGYRIELQEVESRIWEIPGVRGAAVTLFETEDGPEMAAYVAADSSMTQQDVRNQLGTLIPKYMVPRYIEIMDRLPLTPNGKIDRKSLPVPALPSAFNIDFESDHLVRKLTTFWQDVLAVNSVNKHDDFFDLGGHSITAIKLISKINNEFGINLPLSAIFTESTIDKLSKMINMEYANPMQVKKSDPMNVFPLSNSQIRFLILQSRDSESSRFNLTRLLKITGHLDEQRLQLSVNRLMQRHKNLRSSIQFREGQFVQEINEEVYIKLEEHQFANESDLNELLNALNTKIDFKSKSLMKVYILKPQAERPDYGYVLFVFNHIITDGTSLNIIVRDFLSLYSGKSLTELDLEYGDYTLWQKEFMNSSYSQSQREYWKNKVKNFKYTELPKKENSDEQGHESISISLDEKLFENIKDFCSSKRMTLFAYLVSALQVCIYDLIRQNEISIGVPVSGRVDSGLDDTVGCFVNVLLIQSELNEETTIDDYLNKVNSDLLADLDNQMYPYDQMYIDNIDIRTKVKGKSLYSILFNFLPFRFDEKFIVDHTTFELCEFGITAPKADIEMYTYFTGNETRILASYNKSMYGHDQINEFLTLFNSIIRRMADDKINRISELLSRTE